MDTPFAAVARFNQAAAPVPVRLTLHSGAVLDAIVVGGDEHGLVVTETETSDPRTVVTDDIRAVSVRERSHPRTLLLFIAVMVAWFAVLTTILRSPRIAPFVDDSWIGGGVGALVIFFLTGATKVAPIRRAIEPWRDLYVAPEEIDGA